MKFQKTEVKTDINKIKHISQKFSVTEPVAELLLLRGFNQDEQINAFLNPSLNDLHDPFLLDDMRAVVDKLKYYINNKKKILVFGDYDVDGISASYILLDYFKSKGVNVDVFLPNRYIDGYGLTIDAIDKICSGFAPDLIITVDCGISCWEEVEYIKQKNVDVIITDHHDCPEKLPDCLVIDAKKPNQKYPFKELCGTGVAFKLVEAMENREYAKKYLPVTAIATVADIVPLLDENRAIVKYGLERPMNEFPLGIVMLAKELKLSKQITSQEVSFKLAPKINAAGRMGDAMHSLKLYLEKDRTVLQKLITQLLEYNTERQDICNLVYADCVAELKKINLANYKVIVLAKDNWNIGILGIVAARIAEEYKRPTFLLGAEGNLLKGSCRSVAGINIHSLLTELSDILDSFGGHTMAAGMAIEKSKFNEFASRLNKLVETKFPENIFIPVCEYDLDVNVEDINADYITAFDKLEPFGCQNPVPVFRFQFDKSTCNPMKNNPNHITVQLPSLTLLAFNSPKLYNLISQSSEKDCLAELHVDVYRGVKNCKGIINQIQINKSPNVSAERIGGEYIKQLALSSLGQKPDFISYNKDDLDNILFEQSSCYGTLIIANTLQSYKNFVDSSIFEKNIVCFEYLYLTNSNGYNTICLCPSLNNDFSNFNRIILLDSVLDEGYIVNLNKCTNAKIYIPQNSPFLYTPFKMIDLSRKTFGNYFNIFKSANKQKLVGFDDFNYFNKLKKNYKDINYVQFVVCLNTFLQLGIISVNSNIGEFSIEINSGATSKLEKSHFYNKLELIMKSY